MRQECVRVREEDRERQRRICRRINTKLVSYIQRDRPKQTDRNREAGLGLAVAADRLHTIA